MMELFRYVLALLKRRESLEVEQRVSWKEKFERDQIV